MMAFEFGQVEQCFSMQGSGLIADVWCLDFSFPGSTHFGCSDMSVTEITES